jgi:hypothetical protein
MPYPPPPWRVAGPCAVVTGLVPIDAVRQRVPSDLAIVQARSGRTVASIMVADYQHRATFPYAELAVMPAIVRYRGVRGPWISDIWVDSQTSLEGGRQMWGLAKELADFAWSFGDTSHVRVTAGQQALGSWSWPTPRRGVPYPGWFRGISSVEGDRRRYRARGVAWLARTPVAFQPGPDTPLAALYDVLERPVWMAGRLNLSFGDLRILAPPATADPAVSQRGAGPDAAAT